MGMMIQAMLSAYTCLNCRIGKHRQCWRGDCDCCHGGK
jgi:hypothetical protein